MNSWILFLDEIFLYSLISVKMRTRPRKVNVVTMGCAKNLVDSEVLMKQIAHQGIAVVHNADDEDARTVIINTCGFIQDAKQESIDTILAYVRKKEEGRLDDLFVMGCLSERYKNELRSEIPEVDRYFGVNDMNLIIGQLGGDFSKELVGERVLTTPSHYAYLKISEGCDRKCSFCAIPMIRGKQRSKSVDELAAEARFLVAQGVKEIILIAQDLTAYGTDIYGKRELPRLLDALAGTKGIEWIRLHYAYPASFPEEILYRIRDYPNICRYLDIPFQHISDPVLSRMHRGIDRRGTLDLLDRIRNVLPGAAIRTTLMVGHPGEGEKEFMELLDFVKSVRFERLGVFSYSEEEGTLGAENLKDTVPPEEKLSRLDTLMQLQQSISLEINEKRVGEILRILVDRKEGEFFAGRTEFDSPEVDNEVLVQAKNPLIPGEFVNVHITEAGEFDLFGFSI
jgi:ribosomal protein S12 methylthiotransferase